MKPAERYTSSELQRIQREFTRRAAFSGKFVPIATASFIGLITLGFVAVYFAPEDYKTFAGFALVVVVVSLLAAVYKLFPGIICPGCSKSLERAWGPYCPECGSRGLRIIERDHHAICGHCNKELKWTRNRGTGNVPRRLYRIRACTSCGVSFGRSSV